MIEIQIWAAILAKGSWQKIIKEDILFFLISYFPEMLKDWVYTKRNIYIIIK
jgi:hypothetical protein